MPIEFIILVALGFIAPYLITFLVALIGSINLEIATWISELFWNLVGEVPMFKILASVLQTALDMNYTPVEFLIHATLRVISGALLDAVVIAACIYLVKSFFVVFTQSGGIWYSVFGKRVLSKYISFLGVVLGIVVTNLFKNQTDLIRAMVYGGASILIMLIGLYIMTAKSGVIPNPRKRDRLLANFLIDILIDMSLAISTAMIATCSLEGPRLIFQEGNLKLLFSYLAVETIVLIAAWGLAQLAAMLRK